MECPVGKNSTNYGDYLGLKQLLSCQNPKSAAIHKPAHDEMLFIIVHQAYELWFKQILYEVDSVIELFRTDSVHESNVGVAVSRLQRVTQIQKLLIEQLAILETMTAMDFLEFRNLLVPASGFQSLQFRLIENKLGLASAERVRFEDVSYETLLTTSEAQTIKKTERESTLFKMVERWLERTPFLAFEDFNFLTAFRKAVDEMLRNDEEIIQKNPILSQQGHDRQLKMLSLTKANFEMLFDEKLHQKAVESGEKKLSYKATLAALLIFLYRDEPILHLPFRFLTCLIDIDEHLTTWRHRHAIMVRRMIGMKIGTGGSSGHDYLKKTAEEHKIFGDYFDLATFFVARSSLPALPEKVKRNLGFYYSSHS